MTTYNNSIHSATQLTPYELFTGRTHTFLKDVTFNNEQDFLRELNNFRENLYTDIHKKTKEIVQERTLKLNQDREEPTTLQTDDITYRKENRRNKLTPRFSCQKVAEDNGLTITTHKRQKIHKSKLKKRTKQE